MKLWIARYINYPDWVLVSQNEPYRDERNNLCFTSLSYEVIRYKAINHNNEYQLKPGECMQIEVKPVYE